MSHIEHLLGKQRDVSIGFVVDFSSFDTRASYYTDFTNQHRHAVSQRSIK